MIENWMVPWLIVTVGVFGVLIGSFLNVVVWRVPRGESLLRDSRCPRCDAPIRVWHNVPIISWLALRGRCAVCRARISARYPIIELVTGIAFALVAWWQNLALGWPNAPASAGTAGTVALWLILIAYLWFAAAGIALVVVDLEHQRLPDAIVMPSLAAVVVLLGSAALLVGDWSRLVSTLGGGVALFAFYFLVVLIYPRGMGGGDVKLAPLVGVALGFIGWSSLIVGAFAAFVLGALVGLALITARRATRRTGLPFGPYMIAGAWIGVLWGPSIASAYLGLFGLDR